MEDPQQKPLRMDQLGEQQRIVPGDQDRWGCFPGGSVSLASGEIQISKHLCTTLICPRYLHITSLQLSRPQIRQHYIWRQWSEEEIQPYLRRNLRAVLGTLTQLRSNSWLVRLRLKRKANEDRKDPTGPLSSGPILTSSCMVISPNLVPSFLILVHEDLTSGLNLCMPLRHAQLDLVMIACSP